MCGRNYVAFFKLKRGRVVREFPVIKRHRVWKHCTVFVYQIGHWIHSLDGFIKIIIIEVACCHLDYSRKPSANACVKNSRSKIIIIIIMMKSDHASKRYVHKPESILENKTQNSLGFWDSNRFTLLRPEYQIW